MSAERIEAPMCPVVLYWRAAAARNRFTGFTRHWRPVPELGILTLVLQVVPLVLFPYNAWAVVSILASWPPGMYGILCFAERKFSD